MEFSGLESKKAKDDSHAMSESLGLQEHQTLGLECPTTQSCTTGGGEKSCDRHTTVT